jgi:hypothetical protein
MLYHAANEPDILQEAEKRQNRILDADYHKVEVDPFVEELKHLTMYETQILGETLKELPTLFGGGLGMLNIKSVRLELMMGQILTMQDHSLFHIPWKGLQKLK